MYAHGMSELLANEGVETLSMRVARRLRGAIAENRIVQRDLAAAAGIPQPQMSRRITGFTPFTLDELERVADVLGIELDALLGTGAWEGRSIGLCAIRDSNPEPADSKPRPRHLVVVYADGVAPVVPHRRAGETSPRLVVLGGAA